MGFRWIWRSFTGCKYHLLRRLVYRFYLAVRVHAHDTTSYRKPLGEPNPSAANLALAIILLIVILIQAIFNAWQDLSTSRIMTSIRNMLPSDVLILRDSFRTKVQAEDLVPGDLVTISMGDSISADMRLIQVSADLQFDRSVLTGEARSLFHYELPNIQKKKINYLPEWCCFRKSHHDRRKFLGGRSPLTDDRIEADKHSPDQKHRSPRYPLRQWLRCWACPSNWR